MKPMVSQGVPSFLDEETSSLSAQSHIQEATWNSNSSIRYLPVLPMDLPEGSDMGQSSVLN